MKGRTLWPVILCARLLHAQTGAGANNDYLARLLQNSSLRPGVIVAGLVVAFGLGALHALSPGHGKAIVAAYLVGSRSTARHAALLGLIVTFTHTVSVFILGFATLFLSRFILPERIYPVLGVVSGLGIVWVGATLFFQRLRAARKRRSSSHDHAELPEGEVSLGNLMALGASGGLVPCPSALVLLLSSVALGRIGLGLALMVAFTLGLALALVAVGMVALYARHLIPGDRTAARPAFRYISVASAALIACVGALMTAAALGVIRI